MYSAALLIFSHLNRPIYHASSSIFSIFLSRSGVVELVSDFVVCEEGKPLSPESSRILVQFSICMRNIN